MSKTSQDKLIQHILSLAKREQKEDNLHKHISLPPQLSLSLTINLSINRTNLLNMLTQKEFIAQLLVNVSNLAFRILKILKKMT